MARTLSIVPWIAFSLLATTIANGQTPDPPAVDEPLASVHVMQGTDSDRPFSHGNTTPLIGPPWAMTDWCVQNHVGINERWFYQSKNTRFYGFRATHSPCPWAGDYGQFILMPQTGPVATRTADRSCDYDPARTVMRPDYARVELPRFHVTAELTSSERCAVIRLRFDPADKVGRLLFEVPPNGLLQVRDGRISGYSTYHGGSAAGDFHCYFVGEIDHPITGFNPTGTGDRGTKNVGYVEFTCDPPLVNIKLATSYISPEQARRNLDTETRGGFDAVRQRTADAWQQGLGRITIDATADQRATFYSCLYHAMKYPHRIYEPDASGKPIHYSPWDGRVHDGVAYTDSGLWDTFRTQFPLLSIAYPEQLGEIINGWLNAYDEAGWLPQWPNPGGIGGMPGSHADAMIADAVVKGITGFDYAKAYTAVRRDAFDLPTRGTPGGRRGMREYLKLGYVPAKASEYWVSNSLDYAYDDWCVAQAAKITGHADDYGILMKRSQNYRNLWDPSVQFMRSRDGDGHWSDRTFDEYAWGGGYAESGPWQSSWFAPHDTAGLADLMGGPDAFAKKLDHLFHQPPTFHTGAYGNVIHEMSEFAAVNMGQFAANNQPSFHLPYLYSAIGQPWKTEYWTRRACAELYNATPDGYPGDDDNGSTSAWYILSSIGLYPLTPGHPTYILTSPLFKSVKIALPGGKTFTVEAADNSPDRRYVRSRTVDGRNYTNTWISHAQIVDGGTVIDQMSDKPAERPVAPAELPYSARNELTPDHR